MGPPGSARWGLTGGRPPSIVRPLQRAPAPTLDDDASISRDDRVEIAATYLGAFILGASFAKDFLMHGKFEVRIFFLGLSPFVLFAVIAVIAQVRVRVLSSAHPVLSVTWTTAFLLGSAAAVDLFHYQFLAAQMSGDLQIETTLFLVCYSVATHILYALNRDDLLGALRRKTVYKYLLAPMGGVTAGAIVTSILVRLVG